MTKPIVEDVIRIWQIIIWEIIVRIVKKTTFSQLLPLSSVASVMQRIMDAT